MVGYEVGKGKVGDEEVRCYIDFTRSFDITGGNSTVWCFTLIMLLSTLVSFYFVITFL